MAFNGLTHGRGNSFWLCLLLQRRNAPVQFVYDIVEMTDCILEAVNSSIQAYITALTGRLGPSISHYRLSGLLRPHRVERLRPMRGRLAIILSVNAWSVVAASVHSRASLRYSSRRRGSTVNSAARTQFSARSFSAAKSSA